MHSRRGDPGAEVGGAARAARRLVASSSRLALVPIPQSGLVTLSITVGGYCADPDGRWTRAPSRTSCTRTNPARPSAGSSRAAAALEGRHRAAGDAVLQHLPSNGRPAPIRCLCRRLRHGWAVAQHRTPRTPGVALGRRGEEHGRAARTACGRPMAVVRMFCTSAPEQVPECFELVERARLECFDAEILGLTAGRHFPSGDAAAPFSVGVFRPHLRVQGIPSRSNEDKVVAHCLRATWRRPGHRQCKCPSSAGHPRPGAVEPGRHLEGVEWRR